MKRKHRAGLKMLSKIENDVTKLKPDIQTIYYLFRSYGNMAKHDFEVYKK